MIAKRDDNRVPVLMGVSSVDGITPVSLTVDSVTGKLRAYALAMHGENLHASVLQPRKRDDNKIPVLGGYDATNQIAVPFTVNPDNLGWRIQGA